MTGLLPSHILYCPTNNTGSLFAVTAETKQLLKLIKCFSFIPDSCSSIDEVICLKIQYLIKSFSLTVNFKKFILVSISRYLSMASVGLTPQKQPSPSERCSAVPDMVMEQQRLCQENPQAMPCVGLGAKIGMYECQYQFMFERWNCTSPYSPQGGQSTALKKGRIHLDTLIWFTV